MNTSDNLFVIFVASNSWENYTRRVHYEALTHLGKVVVLLFPNFRNRIQQFVKRDTQRSISPHRVLRKSNLVVLRSPFMLPLKVYQSFRLIRKIQCRILRKVLKREIDRLTGTVSEAVIIFTDARQWLWWDVLENCKKCFDLTDAPWLLSTKNGQERFERLYGIVWMLTHCDIAFCTSERLTDFANHFSEHAFYLPNTWEDIPHPPQALPGSFRHLGGTKKKKIGFLGNINDWLDLNLVDYIARKVHDSDLLFVGPINGSAAFRQRFGKLVNDKKLVYVGSVLQTQMGTAIDRFDVCIVPYAIDHFKIYVHPNKLYYYLSRGKPVVTTRFTPDLNTFSDLISVARDYEDFVLKLKAALDEKNPDMVVKRKRFAMANSATERARRRAALLLDARDRSGG